jgi:outer membrane protein TolC
MKYKMKLFRPFSLAVLLFFGIQANAQQPIKLSLDSAVNYAISHNRTLINSRYAVDKSVQKIKETISQGLPQVNASVDYSNFLGATASLQLNPSAPPAVIEFNPTSNFKASASQLIFSGSYFVGVQLSKLGKSIAEQSYQKDEQNVKEQVIQAYYMVLASERILTILDGNKTNVQLIQEKTQNLANAGVIEQTDAKKLSILVTSVENAIKSTQRQVEFGYNLLRLQLGIESEQAIQLSTRLDDIALQYIRPTIAAEAFNIHDNQDFKLVSMQGEVALKSIQLKKAGYLPTLAAFYSYTEKLKKPVFDLSPKNVIGLTLNVPIFSGGQRSSQVKQAKIDYEISENTKDLLTQQLTVQESQLRFNYNNLIEQYQNQKANVEIAKEVLENMKRKYQQGIISSLELTSSNTDYLNAESNYTGIMLQLLNAEASLRKINSKL